MYEGYPRALLLLRARQAYGVLGTYDTGSLFLRETNYNFNTDPIHLTQIRQFFGHKRQLTSPHFSTGIAVGLHRTLDVRPGEQATALRAEVRPTLYYFLLRNGADLGRLLAESNPIRGSCPVPPHTSPLNCETQEDWTC